MTHNIKKKERKYQWKLLSNFILIFKQSALKLCTGYSRMIVKSNLWLDKQHFT